MPSPAKRITLLIAALAIAGVALVTTYALGVPPFERRGAIKADEVCEPLGGKSDAVPALEATLPKKPRYQFEEILAGKNPAQGGSDYTIDCFVWAKGRVILSARTQMMVADPSDSWVDEAIDGRSTSGVEKFSAGALGFVSYDRAAILVPCSSPGRVIGGSYSLSVVVKLTERDGPPTQKIRQGLVDLALGAARFAHSSAKCDLPSKLPAKPPRVSHVP